MGSRCRWLGGRAVIVPQHAAEPLATFHLVNLGGEMTSATDGAVFDDLYHDTGDNLTADFEDHNGYTATVSSGYEADGLRTSSELRGNGQEDYLNIYGYDTLGRETSGTQQGIGGGNSMPTIAADDMAGIVEFLSDRWLAAHPQHRLVERERESRVIGRLKRDHLWALRGGQGI